MYAVAGDGTRLYYETAGEDGTPILFVHEFGGNYDAWEPQMSFFARRHRCITYAARGYAPSEIPADVERYSQALAASDALCVLDALGIERAHVVGLSMGGFATLHFGLNYPGRALSLTVAGAGYGTERETADYFRNTSLKVADNFERDPAGFSKVYALGASRVQFQNKDPRGWAAFAERLSHHSAVGAANTMRGVQCRRPSFWDLEDELKRM
ncbi:MAG: alpha/beta hydrolase, partial [Chelatococcus sp.]